MLLNIYHPYYGCHLKGRALIIWRGVAWFFLFLFLGVIVYVFNGFCKLIMLSWVMSSCVVCYHFYFWAHQVSSFLCLFSLRVYLQEEHLTLGNICSRVSSFVLYNFIGGVVWCQSLCFWFRFFADASQLILLICVHMCVTFVNFSSVGVKVCVSHLVFVVWFGFLQLRMSSFSWLVCILFV